jgi:hypothetical protein
MKHAFEIFKLYNKGWGIERIRKDFNQYSNFEIVKSINKSQIKIKEIAQSEIQIQTEQYYIVPSKMNYL